MDEKRQKLIDRLNKNLADYHAHLLGFGRQEIIDMAARVAVMSDVHEYLTTQHSFDEGQLDFLLMFKNPLEVVADTWEERVSGLDAMDFVIHSVCDHQNALHQGYARFDDGAAQAEAKAEQNHKDLMLRLDNNISAYRLKLAGMTPAEIMDNVNDIAATCSAYGYLEDNGKLAPAEMEYLLRFQNPLEVVTAHWPGHPDELVDLGFVMEDVMGEQERDQKRFALAFAEPEITMLKNPALKRFALTEELENGCLYIFQIKDRKHHRHLRHMDYDYYTDVGKQPSAVDYDLVHVESLGSVREPEEYFVKATIDYGRLNGLPEGFSGRPMEVGDIVVITPNGEAHAFFNEGAGFYEKVDYFLEKIAANVEFTDLGVAVLRKTANAAENTQPQTEVQSGLQKASVKQRLRDKAGQQNQPMPNNIPDRQRGNEPR